MKYYPDEQDMQLFKSWQLVFWEFDDMKIKNIISNESILVIDIIYANYDYWFIIIS